jgi:hypothetical protein
VSDEADDETAADSQQESEQQPADSDQSVAQSEEQPADQTDQSTEQSEEQPAEGDESTDRAGDQAPAIGEQTGEQPIDSDQSSAQSEDQAADSDQPATVATADDTQGLAGGTASRAGGGGALGGPGKTTKIQVIVKFMTNTASDPFKQGAITMNVFDGEKGTLLWKLGSMDQQKVTFQDATLTNNIIKSAMFSGVTANSVTVELKVKMLETDHQVDPQIPEVNFGTAAKFEVPATGTLNVDVDVEVTEKEFTVNAANESASGDTARGMLANKEEIQLSRVKSVTNAGAGKFRVVFRIPTKRILILHPPTLEVTY